MPHRKLGSVWSHALQTRGHNSGMTARCFFPINSLGIARSLLQPIIHLGKCVCSFLGGTGILPAISSLLVPRLCWECRHGGSASASPPQMVRNSDGPFLETGIARMFPESRRNQLQGILSIVFLLKHNHAAAEQLSKSKALSWPQVCPPERASKATIEIEGDSYNQACCARCI